MSRPMRIAKVLEGVEGTGLVKAGPCKAIAEFEGTPIEGAPCPWHACGFVIVGSEVKAACWVHRCAARNPNRAKPLRWQK